MVLLSASCASDLTTTTQVNTNKKSAPVGMSSSERQIAERVYSMVNSTRKQAGKRKMSGHVGLNTLAQKHSADLARRKATVNARHFGSGNRAQYAQSRYNIEGTSEMVYTVPAGDGDPASYAVSAWKTTPRNYAHMIKPWDYTGVGVKRASSGDTYVTIMMGARASSNVPRSVLPIGW